MYKNRMKLRCVIVDDEQPALDELSFVLSHIDDVEVVGSAGSASSAIQAIKEHEPDVVFLDIHLRDSDGFHVLEGISSFSEPPLIIFVTAYDQYAIRAFEKNAVDYVLKPFSESRIRESLSRVRQMHEKRDPSIISREVHLLAEALGQAQDTISKVPVENQGRILLLDTGEILFFRADEGKVAAHTMEGSFPCHAHSSLDEMGERLKDALFFRTHRSYLVNLSHVREIIPWVNGRYLLVMSDKGSTEIPVSRNRVRTLKEKLGLMNP